MADFLTIEDSLLRCVSKDIIPVSIRLRSNIKRPKGHHIIRKS